MKQILSFFLILVAINAVGQIDKSVFLKWKVDKNERLTYNTVMDESDTCIALSEMKGFFKPLSETSEKIIKKKQNMLNDLNQAIPKLNYQTTLVNKGNGIIDIEMIIKPKEHGAVVDKTKKTSEIQKLLESVNQGAILRGSVYETGEIQSFWLESKHKNLIALLFELPAKSVKIGDKWSLDVNLLSFDQNFVCDSSYKVNEVILKDIKSENSDTVAVLEYNIKEYVKGNFITPPFMGNDKVVTPTTMNISHKGTAEFSVNKGRWIYFDGIMNLESTGVLTSIKTTKLKLNSGEVLEK